LFDYHELGKGCFRLHISYTGVLVLPETRKSFNTADELPDHSTVGISQCMKEGFKAEEFEDITVLERLHGGTGNALRQVSF